MGNQQQPQKNQTWAQRHPYYIKKKFNTVEIFLHELNGKCRHSREAEFNSFLWMFSKPTICTEICDNYIGFEGGLEGIEQGEGLHSYEIR